MLFFCINCLNIVVGMPQNLSINNRVMFACQLLLVAYITSILSTAPVYFGNWNFGIEHFWHMEFCQLEFWHMEF